MSWETALDNWVTEYLPDLRWVREEPLSRHTSFKIGGPARRMAFPVRQEQLVLLLGAAEELGARPLMVGNGTNLLAPDGGVDRLVIVTTGLKRLEAGAKPHTVVAEAGVTLAQAADLACRLGLTGLEFAHGIPGTVGGGLCMNAGAYDGELKTAVETVDVLFPEGVRRLTCEEMRFGYRQSLLMERPETAALGAVFRLTPGDPERIRKRMRELMAKRKASQPLELPSAGSTFKRPPGQFAGTLIERCGLKGLTVGGAQVSEKHAGFLVNRGGATCADVLELIRQVRERVEAETGVLLEPEVKIMEA